jgi:integrase
MMSWAVERNLIRSNPTRDVKPLRYATDGFHAWTPDEVKQFEVQHKVGTKARLALALMLYLGVRRGDVVTLGRQHVRDGVIRFVPLKTRRKKMHAIEIPILPGLAKVIEVSPTGDLTFPDDGMGQAVHGERIRRMVSRPVKRSKAPPMQRPHGLHKAGATIVAERGATDRQLMAMFGWERARQATIYTAAADHKQLAAEATRLMPSDLNTNTDCPTRKKRDVAESYEGGGGQ